MPSQVPTPVAAALGLVPAALDGVRALPSRAAQLPLLVLSSTLTGLDRARREYEDLATRGERLLARWKGTSFDDLEDRVEDRLRGTPLARPYDAVEDALEDAGEVLQDASATVTRAVRAGARRAATARSVPGPANRAAPATGPTPAGTRTDTAAAADVVQTVEQVVERTPAGQVESHDELPLPDYDHMTLGSLRGRLRSLTVEQLVQVRDYEKAHASRLPVVTMLDNRIAKLATDQAASASQAPPGASAAPEKREPARGGSRVSPRTGGPAQNPPTGGVPTNPAQPRS